MHHYLRAIGFSNLHTQKQLNFILEDAVRHPTSRSILTIGSGVSLVQLYKEYGENFGISIIGEYDDDNELITEHYFPYFLGSSTKWEEGILIESHTDKEAYSGVSESYQFGIPLIFYLINISDYVRTKWSNEYNLSLNHVSYSGLSIDGKVILGVDKDEEQLKQEQKGQNKRKHLIAAAKNGDTEAIENLTLDDIDLYSSISKRAKSEDLYSIVDSSLIPYGINSEQYSLIGSIHDIHLLQNTITQETMYQLLVNVNETPVDILINTRDLTGEPAIGRRFKGTVWMQGNVVFP